MKKCGVFYADLLGGIQLMKDLNSDGVIRNMSNYSEMQESIIKSMSKLDCKIMRRVYSLLVGMRVINNKKWGSIMTERELYSSMRPQIEELASEVIKLTDQQYMEWREEWLQTAPERIKVLVNNVLTILDECRRQAHK